MTVEVRSGKPIEQATLAKIKDIFKESKCPNESLQYSVPEFTRYTENAVGDNRGIVELAVGDTYREHIEIS